MNKSSTCSAFRPLREKAVHGTDAAFCRSLRPLREKVAEGRMRGFTLIELLVVVMIIAILAAIAVPQYKRAVLKSRFSTVMPMAKSIANAQEVYYQGRQMYALDVDELDVTPVNAENTSVTLSQTDGYDYVMAQNSQVPGANYIIYQKYSENYPSEIHCEAADDNADAQWLCGVLSNNNSIGKTVTDGYTTYVINGTGAGGVPGSTGGDEPGGNSEPETPTCSGEQPADITASNSGATGTASCVNGQWVYEWTGGATYAWSNDECNGSSTYACAGATFSGTSSSCYGNVANGCAGTTMSGTASRCYGNVANGCAGATITGNSSKCMGNVANGCADVTINGIYSSCYGEVANGCADATITGNYNSCDGNVANGCAGAEIQAGSVCNARTANGCDGALYGAHPDKDPSVLGSCSDYYANCPTGVPLQGNWNSTTQAFDISGWKGDCCNPAYMVSGECPSGIAICS